ncbi:E3 ubiquitin-protein ligase rnf8-A-like [Hyalella azteca]|uniref:E3 ubiquitin-protein ligase rnf8-A-like n=1 Tax=Hyalella azteca TaxID=294128 RepID=A0A979FSL2_HYAAZ|nr:E3 ubiquitin-protein ligase rnf8-A-like [Hyalella azteca]
MSDSGLEQILNVILEIICANLSAESCSPYNPLHEMKLEAVKEQVIALIRGHISNVADPVAAESLENSFEQVLRAMEAMKMGIKFAGIIGGQVKHDLWSRLLHVNSVADLIAMYDEEQMCAVCLSTEISPNTNFAVLASCPHIFCVPCISEWGKTRQTCPLCRQVGETYTDRDSFLIFKEAQSEVEAGIQKPCKSSQKKKKNSRRRKVNGAKASARKQRKRRT